MSILWIDGFDHYGSGFDSIPKMLDGLYAEATAVCSTTYSRTGSHSAQCSGAGMSLRRVLGGNYNTVGLAGGYYFTQLPTANNHSAVAEWRDANNLPQVSIVVSPTGEFLVKTGGISGVVVATSGQVVVSSAWQHIEVKAFCDDATGAVEIRLNGVTVLSVSDINTKGAGSGAFSQVSFGALTGNNGHFYIDDVISWEADSGVGIVDFVGMKRNFMTLPDSDTLVSDFLKSTGSQGFPLIGKSSPNDSTYIYAQNSSDVSEFELAPVSSPLTGIACVATYTRAKKLDEGAANLQVSMVSDSSAAEGVDRPITTTETYYHDIFELDPDTGSAWTAGGVADSLLRVEKTA